MSTKLAPKYLPRAVHYVMCVTCSHVRFPGPGTVESDIDDGLVVDACKLWK